MLRNLLIQIIDSEISQRALSPAQLDVKLNTLQTQLLREFIKQKSLLSYLELASSLENNTQSAEHYKKLTNLFNNNYNKALKYLLDFAKKNYYNHSFVHDACLFPAEISKNWQKLATQENCRLLLDNELKQMLFQTAKIEKQFNIDRAHCAELGQEIYAKYQIYDDGKLSGFINKKITKLNNFCDHMENKIENAAFDKYKKKLAQREELYADRSVLNLKYPLKNFSINQLRDYYARFNLYKINNVNIKSYFFKHGLSEHNYKKFLGLNRKNAGINMPDILIDGASINYPGFYLKKLNVQNQEAAALAACLGKLTNCCQSLSGEAGECCVIHGLTNPNGAFYVLFKGDINFPSITDLVYAQTWAWKSVNGAIVFDSIETKSFANNLESAFSDESDSEEFDESLPEVQMIIKMYRWLAFRLVHEHGITLINCGTSNITQIGHCKIDEKNIEKPLDYDLYRDSYTQQMLADQRILLNLDSTFQPYEKLIINNLTMSLTIEGLEKIHSMVNFAYKLQRKDISDYLVNLAKKFSSCYLKYLQNFILFKDLLKAYCNNQDQCVNIFLANKLIAFNPKIIINEEDKLLLIETAFDKKCLYSLETFLTMRPNIWNNDRIEKLMNKSLQFDNLELIALIATACSKIAKTRALFMLCRNQAIALRNKKIEILLDGGADLNYEFSSLWRGCKILNILIAENNFKLLIFLLNYKKYYINHMSEDDTNHIIHLAIKLNRYEILRYLLTNKKDINLNLIIENKDSFLNADSENATLDVLDLLLQYGADPSTMLKNNICSNVDIIDAITQRNNNILKHNNRITLFSPVNKSVTQQEYKIECDANSIILNL